MASRDSTAQKPVRVKGSTKCIQHNQKDVVYYCATCRTLICSKCGISEQYCKQHDLLDISEVAKEKMKEIRTFINNVESGDLRKLKLKIQSIDLKLEENSTLFKELGKKMKTQANKCKEEIDTLTGQFVSLCDKMENMNAKLLLEFKDQLNNMHRNLVDKCSEYKQTLQNGTEVEIFDASDTLPDLGQQVIPELPVMEKVDVFPLENVTGLLQQALGICDAMHKLMKKPKILSRFRYDDEVLSVNPTLEEHAWVPSKNSVALVDNTGNTVRKLSVEIGSMCVAPKTGHIWFTSSEKNTIHELPLASAESPITRFETGDKPRRLCVTPQNCVLVGTKDRILLYTAAGAILLSTSNTTQASIVRPWKIAQCPVTGNIAVGNEETEHGNYESESKSHVIVFDQDLNIRFVYRGEDISDSKEISFAPGSLAYDYKGNLVVADYKRNTIELMSGTGAYIRRIHTAKGLWQGNIGMQPDNVLWSLLLSETGKREILRIKYYTN
ncbi:uncharacterized protein LOC132546820 [Ylistrum balloti]|uniref:uncharacterized protein LOC132546820 n=1 Tax=Ylistrum balloti TaxID=509963 RepID=UPI002905E8DD|nr:uncharacterized protein LOC132546820 [Ylistrum balloti]